MMKGLFFILLSLTVTFQADAKPKKKKTPPAACRLAEGGWVDHEAKALVIQQGEAVIGSANRLEDALITLENLKKEGRCATAAQECHLAGEGVVAGSWEAHRILVDGQAVAGGRDLGSVMTKLTALRDSGTCTF